MPPIIGITTDLTEPDSGKPLRTECSIAYARCVCDAGGIPVLLPPILEQVGEHARLCDGFVFSGGDDPRTEAFGVPTHPAAKPVHPQRQAYEVALLDLLRKDHPGAPVLGVCLGMQMMALHEGGRLDQHLPDSLPTADQHRRAEHEIASADERAAAFGLGPGRVWSNHRQAVADSGRLRVIAKAPDGVIEAVVGPDRPFYCGVQWHPERTSDPALGTGLFAAL